MRIALCHNPPPGGAGRSMAQLARHLAQRHEVALYRLSDGVASFAERSGEIVPHITPFHPHRRRRGGLYWNDWQDWRDLRTVARTWIGVAREVDAGHYDVALVSLCRHSYAPALLRVLATPSLYFCHEPPRGFFETWCRPDAGPLDRYEFVRHSWQRPGRAFVDAALLRQDLANTRAALRIATNSRYTARRIRTVYRRTAAVSYLGVDAALFKPSTELSGASRVISVGALEAHKGFDFVIRALEKIPARRRPRLTIVGTDGHPRMAAHLQRLAASLAVELEIQQNCADTELAALYRTSALFVFAAHYEPFGLVVLEAMASGLPVVVVAEGGATESVVESETGYVVPRQEQAFADAVQRVLDSDCDRRRMGVAARSRVETHWTWSHAAQRIEAELSAAQRNAGVPLACE